MKKTIFISILLVLFAASSVCAQVWVDPYNRRDGSYVPGHYRSQQDNTPLNNWSTRGNVNPYTGEKGYTDPYRQNTHTYGESLLHRQDRKKGPYDL